MNNNEQQSSKKISILALVVIVLILVAIIFFHKYSRPQSTGGPVSIIIAPHLADAESALGGMIALDQRPTIIADFFDATTTVHIPNTTVKTLSYNDADYGGDTTTEETDMALDIQSLLAGSSGRQVYIYGPATFNQSLNDPDTQLLHQAFIDVASDYPASSTQFFIYENYPAAQIFYQTIVYSLEKNLENETGLDFSQVDIPLSQSAVNTKTSELNLLGLKNAASDEQFTETRCGTNPANACEVVYEVSEAGE